jgi:hypothetical protein
MRVKARRHLAGLAAGLRRLAAVAAPATRNCALLLDTLDRLHAYGLLSGFLRDGVGVQRKL